MVSGMATIHREIWIDTAPEKAWDALRDVGALHTRLVPGYVVDTRLDGNERFVTFGDGTVLRERIVTVDDERRRVVWTATGGPLAHHQGAAQVLAERGGTRFVWIADVLPDAVAADLAARIEQGIEVIGRTLGGK
jgi:carbon monoxide dehydrogenase subunit G